MTELFDHKRAGEKTLLDKYSLNVNDVLIQIEIVRYNDYPVPLYTASITNISDTTKLILEKIRQDFVRKIDFSAIENFESNDLNQIQLDSNTKLNLC